MARKGSPTIVQEELYPPPGEPDRESLDDARLVDLDVEEESPFLRGQKRVSARRSPLPKKALSGLKWTAIALFALCLASIAGGALYQYGERNWRFRINSSDDIEISGIHNVPHAQVMDVLGGDIGRNIFFIPLAERKAQLEKIPWVESASVMRFVPNRLVVEIHERTPIAFARLGSRIALIDAGGTLMELPGAGKQKYSFPVIVGMNPGEPSSTRAARMKIYNELLRELDSDGAHSSQDLSEVDISDQDDVKVLANDPAGAVLVHLGSSDFLTRYKVYVTHVQSWRQQFEKLDSVDLRYDHQIIVNPDQQGAANTPQLTPAAEKAAMAAGVKQAALIHVISTAHPVSLKPVAPRTIAAKPADPTTTAAAPASPIPATRTVSPPPKPVANPSHRKATRPATKKTAHRSRHKAATKKSAKAASTTQPVGSQPVTKPPAQTTAPAPAKQPASAKSQAKNSAPDKKKPSPAIAKNQDQQDHP
jgi:cell division protein FtsQ